MFPLLQVAIDNDFRFARVGQNRSSSLGSGSLQELEVDLFRIFHRLFPEFKLLGPFLVKHGTDECHLVIELDLTVTAVALALL